MKFPVKYMFLLFLPFMAQGQVYLGGLSSNPEIKNYLNKTPNNPELKASKNSVMPLHLPFRDDFSNEGVYPDPTKWMDSLVYVNPYYPVLPVNYGVATFDILNDTGGIYSDASIFPFIADYLTSYPIRMDSVFDQLLGDSWKMTPADSAYFSFYYQPQGRGDAPLHYDSLVLEFGTTEMVYSGMDYFWLKLWDATNSAGEYYGEGDTIRPNDTIFYFGCDTNFVIANKIYIYTDSVNVPCDSIITTHTNWKNIWSAPGEMLDTFLTNNNVYFKLVMIPITDTVWYQPDFQFRFYNYGSLASINSWKSNTDHWNIDQVYLNTGRSKNDIFTHEIKFVEPATTMLQSYTSMPMYHYGQELVRETVKAYVNNNDSIEHPCTYSYFVQDAEGNNLPGFTEGYSGILQPFYNLNYVGYQPFAEAPVLGAFDPEQSDTVSFLIMHIVYDTDDPFIGDTIYYEQVFSNYFSYDDGTAERSYGASAANIKMAVQFRSYQADTLRGVQVFFNQVQGNYNNRYFHIGVWNDNNGKPGTLIYNLENQKPYLDKLNQFSTFIFPPEEPIRLGVYNYYISITQTTFDNLNIGFDRNTNTKSRTFYSTDGTWNPSPFDGTLMIRPVFGKALSQTNAGFKSLPDKLEIFPNPPAGNDLINLTLPSGASSPQYWKYMTTRVYDLSGRLMISAPFDKQLSISHLEPGFYIIDILDEAFTKHYTAKLLITK
jgi:hypothetical protein